MSKRIAVIVELDTMQKGSQIRITSEFDAAVIAKSVNPELVCLDYKSSIQKSWKRSF